MSKFRFVKRADAWLNTKTGLYVHPGDEEYEKALDAANKRLDRIIKKMRG